MIIAEIATWTKNYAGLAAPQRSDLGYDNADQLTTAPLKNASTNALIKQFTYGYDTASNRTSETVATTTTTSTPNSVNEITSQSGGVNRTLTYDLNGNVVEKYTYLAFGQPRIFSGAGTELPGSAVGNRFMYTGREWIAEFWLYDYRNRFYFAPIGRFLQSDPTGFDAGDMNLFRYCDDDPVDGSDPMGLENAAARTFPGSTITDRLRLFYGDNAGGSLYELDHPNAGLIMATVPRNAENSQGAVKHGDGYGSSAKEAGLSREQDAKKSREAPLRVYVKLAGTRTIRNSTTQIPRVAATQRLRILGMALKKTTPRSRPAQLILLVCRANTRSLALY